MLTEPWDLDVAPELPPRWDAASSPAKTVYLDQWCFNHLADDRAGRPRKPEERGCFDFFRRLAMDGRVVFLLSSSHYHENGVRTEADERWRTAEVMAELTGFNTITATGLELWEVLEAVAELVGIDAAIEAPDVFGWGWGHCLLGEEVRHGIKDATGQLDTGEHLPEAERDHMQRLSRFIATEMEMAVLARGNPRLAPHMEPIDPLPPNDLGKRLMQEEERIKQVIADHSDDYPRTPALVRASVEAVRFVDPAILVLIARACLRLGVDPDVFIDRLRTDPAPGLTEEKVARECLRLGTDREAYFQLRRDQLRADPQVAKVVKRNRKNLSRFLAAMPVQGRHCELRVKAHLQPGRKLRESDALDYFQIASISPFVDYMVVDGFMEDLTRQAGLHKRRGAMILRHLDDLRNQLRHDLGGC